MKKVIIVTYIVTALKHNFFSVSFAKKSNDRYFYILGIWEIYTKENNNCGL